MSITIPLHGRVALTHDIAACLLKHTLEPGTILPRIVHLDISYQVWYGCWSCFINHTPLCIRSLGLLVAACLFLDKCDVFTVSGKERKANPYCLIFFYFFIELCMLLDQ